MFTLPQLRAMSDNELATYASGGYGPAKRNEFAKWLRAIAEKADAKDSIRLLHFGAKEPA
jgi:hypothetical protein